MELSSKILSYRLEVDAIVVVILGIFSYEGSLGCVEEANFQLRMPLPSKEFWQCQRFSI